MREPNGGERLSFIGMMLSHGCPAMMIRVPEFRQPRRIDAYELRSRPDVTRCRWHVQPPGLRHISGRTSFENDTSRDLSLSRLVQPRWGAYRSRARPPSLVASSAPT